MDDKIYYWPHEKYESPDLSPPNEETHKKFGIGLSNHPVYCDTSVVWATGSHKNSPVYAVYDRGTNWLFILERVGDGEWREINLKDVDNLYGLIWKLTLKVNKHE